jgi:uncharacterized protein YecT (DUF1311 family)
MIGKMMLIAVMAAFVMPAARANDAGDPNESCDGSTAEMVDCLATKTQRWDKRMSIAYQQAMKDAPAQQHDQLRAAQRLWIQYRDANCLYYGMGEVTIARVDAAECLRRMTEARARELEAIGRP